MLFATPIPAQRPPADDLTTRQCLAATLLSLLTPVFRTFKKCSARSGGLSQTQLRRSVQALLCFSGAPQPAAVVTHEANEPDLLRFRSMMETNECKKADFTQSDKRPEHVAAVTF